MNYHQFCPSTKSNRCLICGGPRDDGQHSAITVYIEVLCDGDGRIWARDYEGHESSKYDTAGSDLLDQDLDTVKAVREVLEKLHASGS